jgi:hypothetical protein
VFVVKDHEEEIVKVFDFGLAKGVDESGPLKELRDKTGEGVLLGTPRYMSPEQAHGAKRVDHRTDLLSMAVIAYLAVTSRMPFDGKGVGEIITKIVTESHVPPTTYVDGLPQSVDSFFERAFAKEPEDRFESAQEFADAFEQLLSDGRMSQELLAAGDSDTIAELERLDQADTEAGNAPSPAPSPVSGPPADEEDSGREPIPIERGASLVPAPARRMGRWAGVAALAAAAALTGFFVARAPSRVEALGGRVAPVVFPALPGGGADGDSERGDGDGSPVDDEGGVDGSGPSARKGTADGSETARGDGHDDSNGEQGEDDGSDDEDEADTDEAAPEGSSSRGLELFDDRH